MSFGFAKAQDKPAHHKVPVVEIKEILPHPNADKLDIIQVGGFQAIVGKGEFKPGDKAIYIYPDSVVPERKEFDFLWRDSVMPGEPVPVRKRRITAKKLRGEWSEGLLLPAKQFNELRRDDINYWGVPVYSIPFSEGADVSEYLGITHYQPPEPGEDTPRQQRGKWPRSWTGWKHFLKWKFLSLFGKHEPLRGNNERGPKYEPSFYDIENFKNYTRTFEPGELVVVTEKIHGSQGKYVFSNDHMYAGSRNWWKHSKSTDIWRRTLAANSWIEDWCKRNPDHFLFGEVVPTQGGFSYGATPEKPKFFVFDILKPDHSWVDAEELFGGQHELTDHLVPLLYMQPFDEQQIKEFVDGKSRVPGANHKREGVVVKPAKERRTRGLGRVILKLVSNEFLVKTNEEPKAKAATA